MDLARKATGDHSVLLEAVRHGDTLWVLPADARRGEAWAQQEAWVDEAMRRCSRLALDATGLGSQFAEILAHRYPGRVEGWEFTSKSKEQLATGLRSWLETGRLRLPKSDSDLRRDVLSLRRQITAAANVRFDAPRTAKGHADRAWALALAIQAGDESRFYQPPRPMHFRNL